MHDSNTGALAAQVAMNTTLSAATGGITVFVLRYFITKKYDVGGLCNGILAGLGAYWGSSGGNFQVQTNVAPTTNQILKLELECKIG